MSRAFVLIVTVCVLSFGCGGSKRNVKGGDRANPVIPKADPKALRQFDRGLRALKLGGPERFEKARPRFEKAVAADDKLWEAWHNLGAVHFGEGEDESAVRAFSKALDVNPNHIPTLLGRAEAHRRSGKKNGARKDYERAIKEDPSAASAYARLASLHRANEDYEDGLDVIRRALVEVGGVSEIYVEQGLLYLAQDRDGLAELVLFKAAEITDKEPAIFNALALVSLSRGRDQEAFERFARASELDPSYLDARFNRASVLLDAGDYGGAKAELSDIVKRSPDDFEARIALGVAHRGLGEYDRARRVWTKVAKSAAKRSPAAGDALWNLAVLTMDFDKNEKKARGALTRFKAGSSKKHPKRKAAEERLSEL